MKKIILLLTILSYSYCGQYVFLVNKYDKEIELEAKIIANIAASSMKEKIKLFIPKISQLEKKFYSKYFDITEDCNSANFVFDKGKSSKLECTKSNKLFFTNKYKKLIANSKYYGAFFWNKSRPNIVFIKQRLINHGVQLPSEYKQFVEDFNE